ARSAAKIERARCGRQTAEHRRRATDRNQDVAGRARISKTVATGGHVHPDADRDLWNYLRTDFAWSNSSRRSRSDCVDSGALFGGDPAGERGWTRPDRARNDAFHI